MIAEANLPPQGYQHCFDLSAGQVGVWLERLWAVPGTFLQEAFRHGPVARQSSAIKGAASLARIWSMQAGGLQAGGLQAGGLQAGAGINSFFVLIARLRLNSRPLEKMSIPPKAVRRNPGTAML